MLNHMVNVNEVIELEAPNVPAKTPDPAWPVTPFTIDSPATPVGPVPKLNWVVPPKSVKVELPAGEMLGVRVTPAVPLPVPPTPFTE